MKKIATRYAVALFDLALEQDQLELYQNQLLWIKEVFDDESVFQFFSSVKIDRSDKKKVLTTILNEQIDRFIMNFLMILVEKNRMSLIRSIADEFHLLNNKHNNIQEGVIYSIRKLSSDEHKQIEEAVGQRLDSKVVLKNYINPSLLAGVRIIIGDTVIDASMQSKINQLKSQLLKESR
jgi:F-type H+-transporting ATPase subunit delta